MIKKILATALMIISAMTGAEAQNTKFAKDYYKKALWMTTRFYGAQRSGKGVNWLIAEHSASFAGYTGGKSYIKDADGTYDLTGGWFDCGDFVKFGQTEYYSCYMLLLGYSEFTAGYADLYSADYKGYIKAKDYTYEGGKGIPNGIPDVLDECKYATDYFMKCIRAKDKFYYQVGDGGADHLQWTTSVYKSAKLNTDQGGEANGSRAVYSISQGGTSMVALCGASLAAMSRLYAAYDKTYAAQCLTKAKLCAEFVEQGSKGNIAAQGDFYPAKQDYYADLVILYAELYQATKDNTYKTKAEQYFGSMGNDHGYTICYNNTNDLADYVLYKISNNAEALRQLKKYASDYCGQNNMLNVRGDGVWGTLRYCAAQAFVRALCAKATKASGVDAYTLRTVDYILGDNANNFSFVTGMGTNYPTQPHYRNVFQNDQNVMGSCTLPAKFAQLGYMVGGNRDNIAFSHNINDHERSEGGIDYNAGLVGALGYINSIINPQSIKVPTSVNDAKVAEDAEGAQEVMDLNGRRMRNANGLCIVKKGGKATLTINK